MLEHISIGSMDCITCEQSTIVLRRRCQSGAPYSVTFMMIDGWDRRNYFDAVVDDFGDLVPVS